MVAKILDNISAGSVLYVAPTGSGKTIVAVAVIQRILAKQKNARIFFLAHRKELINQCSEKLTSCGVTHSIMLGSDKRYQPNHPIQVASIQTIINRDIDSANYIIVDEAHRTMARSYQNVIANNPDASVIGLTATPWRLDDVSLHNFFDTVLTDLTIRQLHKNNYLSIPRVFAPYIPDMTKVRSLAGDYHPGDMYEKMTTGSVTGDIVEHWKKLANNKLTIAFASSIKHSKQIAKSFMAGGIPAAHIDGLFKQRERDAVLASTREGKTRVVTNCDIITEGYDLPELSCAILARPTSSRTKYMQMVGRIMRPLEGKPKDAVVLDHAGNITRHGFVQDIPYTPFSKAPCLPTHLTPSSKSAVWVCQYCFAVSPSRVRLCIECGGVRKITPRQVRMKDGRLIEVFPEDCTPCPSCCSLDTETHKAEAWGEFTVLVKCNNCRASKFISDLLMATRATMNQKQKEHRRLSEIRIKKGYKKGWVSHLYRRLFGVWPRKPRKEG